MSTLEAIKFSEGTGLQVLNQLVLPHETKYEEVHSVEDGWKQIREMKVRGAPAIAIVAALSLSVEIRKQSFSNSEEIVEYVHQKLEYLKTSRPTAVNLFKMSDHLKSVVDANASQTPESLLKILCEEINAMMAKDISDNKNIGESGCDDILAKVQTGDNVRILTHCNTGSLATAGYGTALGVIRSLHLRSRLDHVYCTETRPYNQGARLTAYELVHEGMPATLIADSMASILMKDKGISAVVVGADRVTKNGDTANKIGTYQLAIAAKYHNVPFYVCAPTTSIDFTLATGESIIIEERNGEELATTAGVRIAANGIDIWNPAFDITPAALITAIVTEKGVVHPDSTGHYDLKF